ncbi:PqqD family protein [Jingyaoa shaoxingensis]|uniref:PqqD family protein n=1 Tax=Jingyaoa shaoxingensis TaxID=2763671 RepID=A0ABR7N663_9FIRM|nr:PqqD family protein [Jingyaoa shaoxingensis]MBC8571894.1 PqqD family protein [Jingyaoa shaoxingensis]
MKKAEGYIMKRLEDEYIILPYGKKTEEVREVVTLSETAGFIYENAEQAENIEQLAELVGKEFGVDASLVYIDVSEVVETLQKKGILL